jgi:hypothetical protein
MKHGILEQMRRFYAHSPCVQDQTWRWGILALLLIGMMLAY